MYRCWYLLLTDGFINTHKCVCMCVCAHTSGCWQWTSDQISSWAAPRLQVRGVKQSDCPVYYWGREEGILLSSDMFLAWWKDSRQTDRRPRKIWLYYTSCWHDTNNRRGHNCLWKDNPVFLISVHIYFHIGSQSVKPSWKMEDHGLWRRASKEESEREAECELILRTVLDEQRHWQLLSLYFCWSWPFSLSFLSK